MIYRQNFLNRLERKFGRFAIHNLMTILVGAMGIVFIMNYAVFAATGQSLSGILAFDRDAILAGQIWRVFTFLFLPPDSSLIFIVFALYFYWMIGSSLENEWGSFGFTLFYLLGALGAILCGFVSGYATNSYLNLSMFLAFALLNPNFQILLFFFFPIEMKWLALVDAAVLVYSFIFGTWRSRLALLLSLLNLLVFFTPQLIDWVKSIRRRIEWNRKTKG